LSLSAWRLLRAEYASSPEQILSGEGAYLYGGRWNTKGHRMVYLGSSLALSALELLVHMPDAAAVIQSHYRCVELSFDPSLVAYLDPADLPESWAEPKMIAPTAAIGDQWLGDQSSVLLRVPSAVVPHEHNYLFNPQHPDAGDVTVGQILPFSFDPRLALG